MTLIAGLLWPGFCKLGGGGGHWQEETCEWEEEKRFLGLLQADAGAICLSFLSIKQHLPRLSATKQHIFGSHDPG